MILTWIFGMSLAVTINAFTQPWFHLKLTIVLGLTVYQLWMASYASALAHGRRRVAGKTLRLLNEIPGVAAVLIVVLVVVKPF